MKKCIVVLISLIVGLAFLSPALCAAETMYGHISYVEASPKIIRADKTQQDAVLNMPVAPGDQIV
ncbi:MAG: hypothetical protein GY765_00425, partial [bacterium]|nr:hypothetical protein [bacterium]